MGTVYKVKTLLLTYKELYPQTVMFLDSFREFQSFWLSLKKIRRMAITDAFIKKPTGILNDSLVNRKTTQLQKKKPRKRI